MTTAMASLSDVQAFFSKVEGFSVHVSRRFNVATKATGEVTIYGPNGLGETRAHGSAVMFDGDEITSYNFERIKKYAGQ